MFSRSQEVSVKHLVSYPWVRVLNLLHSEWPKLHSFLAILNAIGLTQKKPITTAADDKFCNIFPNYMFSRSQEVSVKHLVSYPWVRVLNLLHSEWPKLHSFLAILNAIGLTQKKANHYCSRRQILQHLS